MSSDDYMRGIRKAQIIQGNGGNPNFIHGANPFEQAGISAVQKSYNQSSPSGSQVPPMTGGGTGGYKDLSEEDKRKAKAIWFVIALFSLLLLSAL